MYQVESYTGHTDQMKVRAKTAAGAWTTLWSRDSTNPAQNTFSAVTLDLAAYKSTGTEVRFSFDSMDTFPRSHPGWEVDDVVVHAGATAGGQLLGNPGFETGSAAPWTMTAGVLNNITAEPPHSGSWDAWLDGYGSTHTDTLAQTVTISTGTTKATLSFWLHIDTAETSTTTAYDTLTLQILNSSGGVLATIHTWSNLDANTGYPTKLRRLRLHRPDDHHQVHRHEGLHPPHLVRDRRRGAHNAVMR